MRHHLCVCLPLQLGQSIVLREDKKSITFKNETEDSNLTVLELTLNFAHINVEY